MEPVFPMPEPAPEPLPLAEDVGRFLELLHESQERKAHLLRIQSELAEVKRKTLAYVSELEGQRRQLLQTNAEENHRANTAQTRLCLVHEALRKLITTFNSPGPVEDVDGLCPEFWQALSEAKELMEACEPYLK